LNRSRTSPKNIRFMQSSSRDDLYGGDKKGYGNGGIKVTLAL
jgi:hypothetical protein